MQVVFKPFSDLTTHSLCIMGYGNIYFSNEPSEVCSRYQRYGYVYMRPFEPGQRYRSRKEMERSVSKESASVLDASHLPLQLSGYKQLRRDMRAVSEDIADQRMRAASVYYDFDPHCSMKTCSLGFTSQKGVGNQWLYAFHPHERWIFWLGKKTFICLNFPLFSELFHSWEESWNTTQTCQKFTPTMLEDGLKCNMGKPEFPERQKEI